MSQPKFERALITGASGGIGAELARQLAGRKLDLILTARREDRLRTLASELEARGVATDVIVADLGTTEGAEELHQKVKELGKPVDVLVNNAGFGVYGKSWEQNYPRIKQMVQVNMVSLTTLTHLFCQDMVSLGRGRILQVASVGAFQPAPLYAVYAATKAYVLSLSVAMNHELAGTGVSITTVCPGLTDTDFHQTADHIKPKAMDALMMSTEDVGKTALESLFAQRPVVTPGIANKLSGGVIKFLPRSWATSVAGKAMEGKREA